MDGVGRVVLGAGRVGCADGRAMSGDDAVKRAIADALVPSGSAALDSRHGGLARAMVADRIVQAIYAAGFVIERTDAPS